MPRRNEEAKLHTKLIKWIKYNKEMFPASFLIETKVSYDDRFPFSNLSEKEERLLLKAKNSFILHTFSDYSQLGTPCDGACISGGGFIFIQWVRTRNKIFYVIDIDDFIRFRESHNMKSMLEIDADMICKIRGIIKN